jgi:hypothetical protein
MYIGACRYCRDKEQFDKVTIDSHWGRRKEVIISIT